MDRSSVWQFGLAVALGAALGCDGGGGSSAHGKQPSHDAGSKHTDAGSGVGGKAASQKGDAAVDGGAASGLDTSPVGSGSGGNGAQAPQPAMDFPIPAGVCKRGGLCQLLQLAGGNKADLLFVVDDSNGMREEQAALRAQFPTLIVALTTGDPDGDGTPDLAPASDLHLGVVSSDMGLLGIAGIDGCNGFGKDGILQHTPSPELTGCQASYPTFLSFAAGLNDPAVTAQDLACIATLGTGGCGFEQPLEAALKALWPSVDPQPNPDGTNRISFLGDTSGNGTLGHGDNENVGFVRNDPTLGLSVIGVIVVSDEDDGSSSNTHHFAPPTFLDPNDPLASVPLNLRNFMAPDELYKFQRYVNGFHALRPGNENMVVFGAIAGVPPDLVDADHIAMAEASSSARQAFYDGVLNDPRMKERVDPASMTTPGSGNLVPSCQTDSGKAFPPRRLVEVARQFGENAFIQSLCQKNLEPAVRLLAKHVGARLGSGCPERALMRDSSGKAACDMIWELPEAGSALPGTPVSCAELDFATDAGTSDVRGGALCRINQAAVQNGTSAGTGWFVEDSRQACVAVTQHIAFTDGAKPPPGVRVFIDCD